MKCFASGLFFGLILLVLATAASAQDVNQIDGDFLTRADIVGEGPINAANSVVIEQVGDFNAVEVLQRQRRTESNRARISQRGDQNFAKLVQTGGNNEVILLQNGVDNVYTLDLEGTSNDIAVIQNGDQNEINQNLLDSRDVNVEFVQNGDGNLIEHQADGLVSKDIKVSQSGNNMQVIINQTTAVAPLK
jgi:hypothetical protein